jgi:hypothetical protein
MKTFFEGTGWNEYLHFYGVIVYEDPATEQRARSRWDQLVHELGHSIRCSHTDQPAEQIKQSLIFEQAYQVDVVIVSVHDFERFFFDAAEWLTDWLSVKPRLPRALFLLHDGSKGERVIEFLRQLATLTGVTLFDRGYETTAVMHAGDSNHHSQPADNAALTFAETWFRGGASRGFSRADRAWKSRWGADELAASHGSAPTGE